MDDQRTWVIRHESSQVAQAFKRRAREAAQLLGHSGAPEWSAEDAWLGVLYARGLACKSACKWRITDLCSLSANECGSLSKTYVENDPGKSRRFEALQQEFLALLRTTAQGSAGHYADLEAIREALDEPPSELNAPREQLGENDRTRVLEDLNHAGPPKDALVIDKAELVALQEAPASTGEPTAGTPLCGAEANTSATRLADVITERRALRDAYKKECSNAGIKVTDEMIAQEASTRWHERSPIQKWAAGHPDYDGAPDEMIRRVFREKPHLRKLSQ